MCVHVRSYARVGACACVLACACVRSSCVYVCAVRVAHTQGVVHFGGLMQTFCTNTRTYTVNECVCKGESERAREE